MKMDTQFSICFTFKVYNLSQNVQEDDLQHLQVKITQRHRMTLKPCTFNWKSSSVTQELKIDGWVALLTFPERLLMPLKIVKMASGWRCSHCGVALRCGEAKITMPAKFGKR